MNPDILRKTRIARGAVGISFTLVMAVVHIFRLGSYLSGNLYILYYSYASDILVPMAFYFLLCLNDVQFGFLRKWYTKSLIVFALATFIEVMQAFGVYMVGVTFDPVDIVMFGVGVLVAAFMDVQVFERLIPGYKINS